MIMNTRDKEITDQPRLNHFDLKSNSNRNIYIRLDFKTLATRFHVCGLWRLLAVLFMLKVHTISW